MDKSAVWALAAIACCTILMAAAAEGSTPPPLPPPQFVYCSPANFANCTKAKCKLKASGDYACHCFLDDRYSATSYRSTCVAATKTTAQSRFHPVDGYQECTNAGTETPDWAWCLGVSCTISKVGEVECACTVPPSNVPRFPYIVVTEKYKPDACLKSETGKVWSSATPGNVSQITAFLQQQPGLQNLASPTVVVDKK
jgi:hypothetical protein